MAPMNRVLEVLNGEIEQRNKKITLSFEGFLRAVRENPQRHLRNIFQLFHDMVEDYVGEGENEYPDDPESIGYVKYDCSKLFVEGADYPFFADRLFANRFVDQVKSLKQGSRQNQLHAYLGPHGCGKSTFLNNLIRAFEKYTSTEAGRVFEMFWVINSGGGKQIEVPCPSHDHPLLIIPRDRNCRVNFLRNLLPEEMMQRVLKEKEYEWVLREEACTICRSLFWALCDKLEEPSLIWEAIKVRPYIFDRSMGEGVSVFNPGDQLTGRIASLERSPATKEKSSDTYIQEQLNQFFGFQHVKYVFSQHAKTNNGIYVLMDVKGENKPRLAELHNIITEGVRKVGDIEERVNSLFIALMNPEDEDAIEEDKAERLEGRIQKYNVSYVLEVPTEMQIYFSVFGEQVNRYFLPRVLENFARVIIASRMHEECSPLIDWIKDFGRYEKYCDESGLLLRMEIYSGIIPPWLSEEDRKEFASKVRKEIVAYGEIEGKEGFDGRESIRLFGDFLNRYGDREGRLITMEDVASFFRHKIGRRLRDDKIPSGFISSLVNWYDYVVLNEIKEALYFYNEEQIKEDILHFLCAINHHPDGSKIECVFTGKEVEVTVDFFRIMGVYLTGEEMTNEGAMRYTRRIQEAYARVLSQEGGEKITETELYQELFAAYVRNLKEKALQPFLDNETFWDAVKAFPDGDEFKAADTRLKDHITHMIENLITKFGYTEQGAKEICLYVREKGVAEKFAL